MLNFLHAVSCRLIISVLLPFSVFVVSLSAHASRECAMPSLNLISLDGKTVPLRKYSGKVIIIAFWTTWCSPCRTSELPGLAALRKEIPNGELIIWAISNDAEKKEVQLYLNHPAIDFGVLERNVFFDPEYSVYHAIIGRDIAEVHPYAVIFDQKGCMVEKFVGAHDWLSEPTTNLINGLLSNYSQSWRKK